MSFGSPRAQPSTVPRPPRFRPSLLAEAATDRGASFARPLHGSMLRDPTPDQMDPHMQLTTTSHQPPLWGRCSTAPISAPPWACRDDPDGTALVYPLKAASGSAPPTATPPGGRTDGDRAAHEARARRRRCHRGARRPVLRGNRQHPGRLRPALRWPLGLVRAERRRARCRWRLVPLHLQHAEQAGVVAIVDGDLAVYDRRNA